MGARVGEFAGGSALVARAVWAVSRAATRRGPATSLADALVRATGAVPQTQGWGMTALLTAIVMAVSVGVGVLWARVRKDPPLASRWRRRGATVFLLYFALSGWGAVYKYARHPELAEKPYYMLPWARAHKGLPATADGLPTPDEHARAKAQRSK